MGIRKEIGNEGKGGEKRNIIIKRLKVKEGKREETVREICKIIEAEVVIEEVKRLGDETGKGREMVWVRLKW